MKILDRIALAFIFLVIAACIVIGIAVYLETSSSSASSLRRIEERLRLGCMENPGRYFPCEVEWFNE